jgi:hypothetical protein
MYLDAARRRIEEEEEEEEHIRRMSWRCRARFMGT